MSGAAAASDCGSDVSSVETGEWEGSGTDFQSRFRIWLLFFVRTKKGTPASPRRPANERKLSLYGTATTVEEHGEGDVLLVRPPFLFGRTWVRETAVREKAKT